MRRVKIQGTPPQEWIDEAEVITQRLREAENEEQRKAIIDAHDGLWRDDRIRNWLLDQFANKCWYTEAYESVSSIHVDHFRPKNRIKDLEGNTCEGYWWLAFNWVNYRISGQLINVKKGDLFPIVEGTRANATDPVSLELESPLLIDPITNQSRLISYEKDEDACIALPAAGIDDTETLRAKNTIEILGLNKRDRLNQKRATFWDACLMAIADYKSANGPQPLKLVCQLAALKRLKEMIRYEAEFSSISEACIRKNAPEAIIACVFEA